MPDGILKGAARIIFVNLVFIRCGHIISTDNLPFS